MLLFHKSLCCLEALREGLLCCMAMASYQDQAMHVNIVLAVVIKVTIPHHYHDRHHDHHQHRHHNRHHHCHHQHPRQHHHSDHPHHRHPVHSSPVSLRRFRLFSSSPFRNFNYHAGNIYTHRCTHNACACTLNAVDCGVSTKSTRELAATGKLYICVHHRTRILV